MRWVTESMLDGAIAGCEKGCFPRRSHRGRRPTSTSDADRLNDGEKTIVGVNKYAMSTLTADEPEVL